MTESRTQHIGGAAALLIAVIVLFVASYGPASAATFTVNTTADAVDAAPGNGVCATGAGECSLRAAVQEANSLAGPDTITVPAGTYVLTSVGTGEDAAATGDIDITTDMTITGAGASATIVDGIGADRVFDLRSASARITGLTVTNGYASTAGGGIVNTGTAVLTDVGVSSNSAGSSAGVLVGGAMTLNQVTVSGNTALGGAMVEALPTRAC